MYVYTEFILFLADKGIRWLSMQEFGEIFYQSGGYQEDAGQK